MTLVHRDSARLRALNDEMRRTGPTSTPSAQWLMTVGVVQLGPEKAAEAAQAVQRFASFDAGNDPYGEHDFGAFELAGERLFWKIDYYDRSLSGHSPDATDPTVTCRVLTIMLASEY